MDKTKSKIKICSLYKKKNILLFFFSFELIDHGSNDTSLRVSFREHN